VFDQLRRMSAEEEAKQHSLLAGLKSGTSVGLDVLVDGAVPAGEPLGAPSLGVLSASPFPPASFNPISHRMATPAGPS